LSKLFVKIKTMMKQKRLLLILVLLASLLKA
jgi:hypothetical protein